MGRLLQAPGTNRKSIVDMEVPIDMREGSAPPNRATGDSGDDKPITVGMRAHSTQHFTQQIT